MADKPQDVQHIVMSVPHSGTRTLQTWLSENRPEVVPHNRDQIGHWHFSLHPKYIVEFFELDGDRLAYVPLRNPYDLCDSWQRRYHDSPDKTYKDMQQAIALMIDCVDRYSKYIELFKIEELPVLRGRGPQPEGWDSKSMVGHPRLEGLKRWILQAPEVVGFYRAYYTAEELWWL